MRRSIVMIMSLCLMAGCLWSCGDDSSSSADTPKQNTSATVKNNSTPELTTGVSVETKNQPTQATLDGSHVDKIMQWVDKSMTAYANSHAVCIQKSVDSALYDIKNKQQYDGVYNSTIPAELMPVVASYFPEITEAKNYCVLIENGEVTACWSEVGTWTEEEMLDCSGDYDAAIELWEDMGFVDYDALHEVCKKISSSYYGSYPNRAISIYDEPEEEGVRYYNEPEKTYIYSNKRPDINQCKE